MTVNDIVALASAGFTADQIAQLGSVAQQPVVQTVQQPAVQTVQQPVVQTVQQPAVQTVQHPAVQQPAVQTVQQPVQQPAVQPVVQPVQQTVQPVQTVQQTVQNSDPFQQIMKQLGLLNTSIQANSLLAAQQPKQESVEDVLASIINPPAKDEKGGKK